MRCGAYDRCLSRAVDNDWSGFTCAYCQRKGEADDAPPTPESHTRLAAAVLVQALDDMHTEDDGTPQRSNLDRRRLKREAKMWFEAHDDECFSFAGCCRALGLPVARTRRLFLRLTADEAKRCAPTIQRMWRV